MNLPQPKYLNLEYFFYNFFQLLKLLGGKILDFVNLLGGLTKISILFSAVFLAGIIFLLLKIIFFQRKKIVHFIDYIIHEEVPEIRKDKWDEIQKKIDSDNSSDWKMAIIEADSLLDKILGKIGYRGENLGEKLKNIESSDFNNLQIVWEAHKIRNRIAHEGDTFQITKEEAKETLEKYQKALKELMYV